MCIMYTIWCLMYWQQGLPGTWVLSNLECMSCVKLVSVGKIVSLGFKLASLMKLMKVVKICGTRFFYSSLILQLWRIKSKMANLCKNSEIFNSCSSLIPSFPINWCSGNISQQLCFHFSTKALLLEYFIHSRVSPKKLLFKFCLCQLTSGAYRWGEPRKKISKLWTHKQKNTSHFRFSAF